MRTLSYLLLFCISGLTWTAESAAQTPGYIAEAVNSEWAIGQDITEQYAHLEIELCELENQAIVLRQTLNRNQAEQGKAQLMDLDSELEFIREKIVYRDERLALATLTLHLSVE